MNLPVLGRNHFHHVSNVVVLLLNFTDEISHSRREFNYENAETDCLLVFSIPLNGLAHSILNVTDFKHMFAPATHLYARGA